MATQNNRNGSNTRSERDGRNAGGNRDGGTRPTGQETNYKVVYGIVERGESAFWTRIGAAFENKDGSFNIRLDFVPTSPDTTLQAREPRPMDEA